MSRDVPVTFEPSGSVVWVPVGTTVLEAARKADVVIPAPCGGRGVCGSCAVRVLSGTLAPATEDEMRGLARAPAGVRLACRAHVDGPVSVRPMIVQSGTRKEAPQLAGSLLAAVDLGTTTVAATAIDAATGREIGRAIVPNRQAAWGADVLSRVTAAMQGDAAELRRAAEESVVEALAAASGGNLGLVERCAVAANTVMAALFSGADVSSLASHPFELPAIPTELDAAAHPATHLAAGARIRVLPPIAGFVGGDAVAAAVATGLGDSGTRLMVDIGTNAEIVLVANGRFHVASAAAGPAFDGSGVSCGGPAVPGAVQSVELADGTVRLELIGGEGEPAWFSGAGLVSALAALRRQGVVSADGAFAETHDWPVRVDRDADGVLGFAFAERGEAGPVCLTFSQRDVRTLQLAKAAVRVGIERVLSSAGVDASDLDHVYVAGAFGAALSIDDLVDLGVVPAAAADRTEFVGNAALAGAITAVTRPDTFDATYSNLRAAVHVDLASDPAFTEMLMAGLALEPYGG